MVSLPKEFISTKVDGYFWNSENKTLYSIKSGVLKEIKSREIYYQRPGPYALIHYGHGYQVSDKGKRRILLTSYLKELKHSNTKIPVVES